MTTEFTLLVFLGALLYSILILLRAVVITVGNETHFEIIRQTKQGSEIARKHKKRIDSLNDITTAKYVLETICTILVIICIIKAFGFIVGLFISFILLLCANTFARIPFLRRMTLTQYEKYETNILSFIKKIHPVLSVIRSNMNHTQKDFILHSREELLHLVDQAQPVLSNDERLLLHHALSFHDQTVGDIMTPRSVTETIKASETLGPIVLDRLHKTGHSRFPVIEENMDHIIGMLYAHDLVKHIRASKAQSVREVMDKKLFYINEHQSLSSALAGFLRTKHHLFIVVDEFEETTGVITIEDVIEALIGRKIVDEFDQYDDLRAVAKRAAKTRNKSAHSTHITDKKTGEHHDTNTDS